MIVEEEMHRTIEFGAWKAAEWQCRATERTSELTPALAEGLRAYALEHVSREKETCVLLSRQWAGLREKARAYLAGVGEDASAEVVIDVGDEDPDDEEGDVEGEEIIDDGGDAQDNDDPDVI